MRLAEFDFELPSALVADEPSRERGGSRLLALGRRDGAIEHAQFGELARWLRAGDLLVINDTRVRAARIGGTKPSGGRVELLLLDHDGDEPDGRERWRCLLDTSRKPAPGTVLTLDGEIQAEVVGREAESWRVRIATASGEPVSSVLERVGRMPLPPYIARQTDDAVLAQVDRRRYQTVFAEREGAVAAPTAGLHFTHPMLDALQGAGIELARITLHVGIGTFLPIRSERVEEHTMHAEWCDVPVATADALRRTRARGGRVVAVGTTVVRTLESHAGRAGLIEPGDGLCSLFIRPGYRFRVIDMVLTNFHLPRSTLLLLVCAFAGRDSVMRAYAAAITQRYRFYSYGDAMLIHA